MRIRREAAKLDVSILFHKEDTDVRYDLARARPPLPGHLNEVLVMAIESNVLRKLRCKLRS